MAPPTPQATIRTIEFGFRGPTTLQVGELVRFENEGFLVHMNIAFPVKSMGAAKQALKLLLAGKEKPVEKARHRSAGHVRGSAVLGRALQQSTITAKPGIYVETWASWTPRTDASTPSWAWSESSRSRSSAIAA